MAQSVLEWGDSKLEPPRAAAPRQQARLRAGCSKAAR